MSYAFDIKILKGSAYAEHSVLKNGSEFLLSSKKFDSVGECEHHFANVISDLVHHENSKSGKNYVVISKLNPLSVGKEPSTTEVWDDSVLYKLYIVDADLLKNSVFECKIFGHLKITA